MAIKIVYAGRFKADSSKYQYFPFTVPEGTKRIEVFLDYEREQGNIIDLGLFDSRGMEFLATKGFRGWSGSARSHVVVSEKFATPGYIPGPIFSGIWHVILGLYNIVLNECNYRLEIFVDETEVNPEQVGESLSCKLRDTVCKVGMTHYLRQGWFKGDLHTHTYHSDAHCSVEELIAAALRRRLDFLAITDHNTISHYNKILKLNFTNFCVIPGEEITTYYGHANVWGFGNWLDFRCTTPDEIRQVCEEAHKEGRLFSINHPKPGGPDWQLGFSFSFDCLEVWQGPWIYNNTHSLELWDTLLREGKRVVAVGGSDSHPFIGSNGQLIEWLGFPTTWVYASTLTPEAILAGIRDGHVAISASPAGPLLIIKALKHKQLLGLQGDIIEESMCSIQVEVLKGIGLFCRVLSQHGELAHQKVSTDEWTFEIPVDLKYHGYVRAELRVPSISGSLEEMLVAALSNPIWHSSFVKL